MGRFFIALFLFLIVGQIARLNETVSECNKLAVAVQTR